jgi:hypothetical protein
MWPIGSTRGYGKPLSLPKSPDGDRQSECPTDHELPTRHAPETTASTTISAPCSPSWPAWRRTTAACSKPNLRAERCLPLREASASSANGRSTCRPTRAPDDPATDIRQFGDQLRACICAAPYGWVGVRRASVPSGRGRGPSAQLPGHRLHDSGSRVRHARQRNVPPAPEPRSQPESRGRGGGRGQPARFRPIGSYPSSWLSRPRRSSRPRADRPMTWSESRAVCSTALRMRTWG